MCNPSTQRLGQEDCEFDASLDYIVRPSPPTQKKKKEKKKKKERSKEERGKEGGWGRERKRDF
jgi:hypothetical protein